jgi:hypothetical protein
MAAIGKSPFITYLLPQVPALISDAFSEGVNAGISISHIWLGKKSGWDTPLYEA